MGSKRKWPWLILEGLNSLGCAFYFNYLFFHFSGEFQLSTEWILGIAAIHGLVYTFSAHTAGKFAQKYGYRLSLALGCLGMMASLALGGMFMHRFDMQCIALLGWTIAVCFTWPPLQALVTEHETPKRTANLVGIYNLVWSGCAAISNFTGGWIFEHWGAASLFYLPPILWLIIAATTFLIPTNSSNPTTNLEIPSTSESGGASHSSHPDELHSPRVTAHFLKLSWISNPLAYIAINTLVPLVPQIAEKLHLSVSESGWFNSTWFFARTAAFLLLWLWTGWHFRKSWLIFSLVAMVGSFAMVTLGNHLATIVVAQILFGFGVGLIYYSSLYYSMSAGAEKGAKGGIHEAAIGLGTFLGPAVGAASLHLKPSMTILAPILVCALLAVGTLLVIGQSRKTSG